MKRHPLVWCLLTAAWFPSSHGGCKYNNYKKETVCDVQIGNKASKVQHSKRSSSGAPSELDEDMKALSKGSGGVKHAHRGSWRHPTPQKNPSDETAMPQQCQYLPQLWQIECNFSSASEVAAVAAFPSLVLASVYRFDPWAGVPYLPAAVPNMNASLATSKQQPFFDADRTTENPNVAEESIDSLRSNQTVAAPSNVSPIASSEELSVKPARVPDSSKDAASSNATAAVESADVKRTSTKSPGGTGKLSYPKPSPKSSCAIFTVVRDEPILLPIWLRYYLRHASSSDLLVLDHATSDNSTAHLAAAADVTVVQLRGDPAFSPHFYLLEQVQAHQQRLLRDGFRCVLFTEVDEIVVADPTLWGNRGNLQGFMKAFARDSRQIYARPSGRTLSHSLIGDQAEPPLNWTLPLLAQRLWWAHSAKYSKPLLTKVPLKYIPGFHLARPFTAPSADRGSPGPHHTSDFPEDGSDASSAGTADPIVATNSVASSAHVTGRTARPPAVPRADSTHDSAAFRRDLMEVQRLTTGPAIPILDDVVLIHLHGADFAYCMARETAKHAKAMAKHGNLTAMHVAEMKLHLSAAYTTKYEENKRTGKLCTHQLETPPGAPVLEIPEKWRSAVV